jgi:hypothetical protein
LSKLAVPSLDNRLMAICKDSSNLGLRVGYLGLRTTSLDARFKPPADFIGINRGLSAAISTASTHRETGMSHLLTFDDAKMQA